MLALPASKRWERARFKRFINAKEISDEEAWLSFALCLGLR
jgi:hypothetical protein